MSGKILRNCIFVPKGTRLLMCVYPDDPDNILVAYVTLITKGGEAGCMVRIGKIIEQGRMSSYYKEGEEWPALYSELELEK